MNDELPPEHPARRPVLYRIPGMERTAVRRGIPYQVTGDSALTLDAYYPAEAGAASVPAVVFVLGVPDAGFKRALGVSFKDMAMSVSWGQLLAASGVAAVFYTNREPVGDLRLVLSHLREHGPGMGIDGNRVGIWGCSGNGPLAVSTLMRGFEPRVACVALCYPYTLDLDGDTHIAEAQSQWRFANPCQGKTLDDLQEDIPIFIARAGRDQFAGLNGALDRLVAGALERNLPLTLVNHAQGPHSFDTVDDSEVTRHTVQAILEFFRLHLGV